MDNLSGFELVLPNGTVTSVTQDSNPDLFWGLKVSRMVNRASFVTLTGLRLRVMLGWLQQLRMYTFRIRRLIYALMSNV